MKLTELRPCDNCNGSLAPMFYRLEWSMGIVTPKANQVLGLAHAMGGVQALRAAEALSPHTDDAVVIAGEQEPALRFVALLCQPCFLDDISLAELAERVSDTEGEADATP